MTHFPDIHTRAANLVRESRGRLNLREAYRELSRRGLATQAAQRARRESLQKPITFAWQQRADLA